MLNFIITFLVLSQAQSEKKDYVWPKPPEKPRYKFSEFLILQEDITGEGGFFKRVFKKVLGIRKTKLFGYPFGIWVTENDVIYVADPGFGCVTVIDRVNKKVQWFKGAGRFAFARPTGIAVAEKRGKVYVADPGAGAVFIISLLRFKGEKKLTKEIKKPSGIAVDEYRNRLYVSDMNLMKILVFDLEGKYLFSIGKKGNEIGEFNYPTYIALDKDGNLYVSEWGNFRVQILNPKGEVLNAFGSSGTGPGLFVRPKGVGVDSKGYIYVSDAFLQRLQIFDKYGNVYMAIEGLGWEPGTFRIPAGVFVDSKDRIYVVEQGNQRVQIFEPVSPR